MRVEVLTPWQHEGVDRPVGSFVEVDEQLVRALKGTLGQEHVPDDPATDPAPAGDPAGEGGDDAAEANGVREEV